MAQIVIDSNSNLIQGDFDSATVNNRTKFQTSTPNANTGVYAVPNGSGTVAGFQAANNSDPTNASKIVMATNGSTDTQIISGVNGSGTYLPLSFYTNNALAMQITTGGIISAAGGGIQFPATQIPSADANTLDDYEEGTWTPTIQGQTTGGTTTYTNQNGFYTKIGNLVTINFYVNWSSATGTGSLLIGGLPFASGPGVNYSTGACMTNNLDWPAGTTVPTLFKPENNSTLEIYCSGDNIAWAQQPMDSSALIIASITYRTA